MISPRLVALSVLTVLAVGVVAQKPVRTNKKMSFKDAIGVAGKAYEAGEYGKCVTALRAALVDAMEHRKEAIVKAFPPAPDGFKMRPPKKQEVAGAAGQALAGMMAMVGQPIEATYTGEGGARFSFSMTVDSPMGGMAAMMFNPMMIQNDPKSELYEYDGGHKAVLKEEGNGRVSLKAMIGGKHIVQISAQKMDKEKVLALLDQDRVNQLVAAIGE